MHIPMDYPKRLGVLTSGGDAQGMNAAVRAVIRTAIARGVEVYAIYEGYQGLIDAEACIRKMTWEAVGGIMHKGGTVIGTARSEAFRTREGRRDAARNLLRRGIDSLVVIGGDGSLTGANLFRQEWPTFLAELVAQGEISQADAERHPQLAIAGLVGSIDNDFFGVDMTIGADSALHRITEAVDAITSTAASHQRTFVVEVMGRHCGYLALMSALATGAEWVLFPESPPNVDDWEATMCAKLHAGHAAGRRDAIVIVAEGAQDRQGRSITADYVKRVLETRLGVDTRVTILGHVQRGGTPSAFDRTMSTILGAAAVDELLSALPGSEPHVLGLRGNRVARTPLLSCVAQTEAVAAAIAAHDYPTAMELRGRGFEDSFRTYRKLVRAVPHPPAPGQRRLRLAVLHCGGLAPGMNTAVRAAVRIGIDNGHIMLGVRDGFKGLIGGDIREMDWTSVSGWSSLGGAELGTNRTIPDGSDWSVIARVIAARRIDGLLIIGGWSGYQAASHLLQERANFPAFNLPIICLPATIDNNLPGSELSIGADTALNTIVSNLDKIKQSAVATQRCFVVEVMGRYCGYLALMSGMATGAERVYLHEEGITLHDLQADLARLVAGFQHGKRLGLMIRNEQADPIYSTDLIAQIFAAEAHATFDVAQSILGHLQQGGNPTPFDRIHAARLADRCITFLIDEATAAMPTAAYVGFEGGEIHVHQLDDLARLTDEVHQRPKQQWWMDLRGVAQLVAEPSRQLEHAADRPERDEAAAPYEPQARIR